MKRKVPVIMQAYPDPPDGAGFHEVVEEYFVTRDNGYPERFLVGKVYCPLLDEHNPDELFNPNTEAAKIAAVKYKKAFANIRRYQRDLERRAREYS